jgi:hypothetical protein
MDWLREIVLVIKGTMPVILLSGYLLPEHKERRPGDGHGGAAHRIRGQTSEGS